MASRQAILIRKKEEERFLGVMDKKDSLATQCWSRETCCKNKKPNQSTHHHPNKKRFTFKYSRGKYFIAPSLPMHFVGWTPHMKNFYTPSIINFKTDPLPLKIACPVMI